MTIPGKVMIVAPFWGQTWHVGVYRVDRFLRWLSTEGIKIVLVKAGSKDAVTEMPWGKEITVKDPLGFYQNASKNTSQYRPVRKHIKLRYFISHFLFNPDPSVLWAIRASKHPFVLSQGGGIATVLSSSPPESAHVAASAIATKLNANLIMDMRDGWLDEPLKPLLKYFRLQRLREGRLEAKLLKQANSIMLSSDAWEKLLNQRVAFTKGKTAVLTNCYPPKFPEMTPQPSNNSITLLYAGQFTMSRFNNRPELLLSPLWKGLKKSALKARIILQGVLTDQDLSDISKWQKKYFDIGCSIVTRMPVKRDQLFHCIEKAHGLLLLSATYASILAKSFEYIPSRKAILSITPKGSSMWRLAEKVPQIITVGLEDSDDAKKEILRFLSACQSGEYQSKVPVEFSEEYVSKIFTAVLGLE